MHRDKRNDEWQVEDTGSAQARLKDAGAGARFDPYHGIYADKQPGRKRDLRKLGEWLKAKRLAEELKREVLEPSPQRRR